MRGLYKILLIAAFATTSCGRHVSLFEPCRLSIAEHQSITNLYPGFAGWGDIADYGVVWVRGGVTRHVCLFGGGGSIIWQYEVFVFDTDGHIVEANVVNAPSGGYPVSLSSISPLLVRFTSDAMHKGESVEIGCAYSHEEGQQKVAEDSKEMLRVHAAFDAWKHSGSTNIDTLRQMVEEAKTNSTK